MLLRDPDAVAEEVLVTGGERDPEATAVELRVPKELGVTLALGLPERVPKEDLLLETVAELDLVLPEEPEPVAELEGVFEPLLEALEDGVVLTDFEDVVEAVLVLVCVDVLVLKEDPVDDRVVVEVFELDDVAVPDFDEVEVRVEVEDVVDVKDSRADRVAVKEGLGVTDANADRVLVRVEVEDAVGSACAPQRNRGSFQYVSGIVSAVSLSSDGYASTREFT